MSVLLCRGKKEKDMYTFEKKDGQGLLNITVSKEDWDKAVEQAYQKNKNTRLQQQQ